MVKAIILSAIGSKIVSLICCFAKQDISKGGICGFKYNNETGESETLFKDWSSNGNDGVSDGDMVDDKDHLGDSDHGIPDWHPK